MVDHSYFKGATGLTSIDYFRTKETNDYVDHIASAAIHELVYGKCSKTGFGESVITYCATATWKETLSDKAIISDLQRHVRIDL
jgi:hypothetical protein